MGTTLDNFKSKMTSFARPNLFEVEITPRGDKNIPTSLNHRLNLNCHTCSIPGLSIATSEKDTPQTGYNSVAYQKIYEDVNMIFYVHGDMKELEVFEEWMKLMVSPTNNHVGFYDNYKSTVTIKNIDRQQKKVLTTTLFEAYPKTVSSIDLNFGSTDEVMNVSVTFTYRYYTKEFSEKEVVGRGNFTETSAEDITDPLSDINTLLDKSGNLVKKNEVGLFVPKEFSTPIPDRFK